MVERRRDPDALLKHVLKEEESRKRGKLKIYLGMAAGVGKTYAMLSDALTERSRGKEVVNGYIEPHGRKETEDLAAQLPRIDPRMVEYRGLSLYEFDLDAALAKHPKTILVDELAHTNAPGSRHVKRWQDIEELLAAGINVCSTVNVQHIDSLKDVISGITGVEIQETVPDAFVARADEIELVDIPPDELIQRLQSGKIYGPEKIDSALRNFFQKGNLVALREIVLRHAADTVDAQLLSLRSTQGVKGVWATNPRVLVSVAPSKFAQRLVRSAARLARHLKAPLIAVTVETARTLSARPEDKISAERALALAESLGAEIVHRAGTDVVLEILRVAEEMNVTIIVAGKPMRGRLLEYLLGSIVDDLIRRSGAIDVYVVQGSEEEGLKVPLLSKTSPFSARSIAGSLLTVTLASALCFLAYPFLDLSNLIMIYLLGVTWVSSRHGQKEAILTSVLSVLCFDFFFVPPRWTFAVSDVEYLITFLVMLIISLLISTLTLRLRAQSQATAERERRTAILLDFSKQLSSGRTFVELAQITHETLLNIFNLEGCVFWANEDRLSPLNSTPLAWETEANERAVADWVSRSKRSAGKGTATLPGAKGYYLPLQLEKSPVAVLGIFSQDSSLNPSSFEILDGLVHLLSAGFKRVQLEEEATFARVRAEREELRNVLLSSVSHDLRTPLTAISGAASILQSDATLGEQARQLSGTIAESATRLSSIVRNVLDLSRFESGAITLQREWHSLDEIMAIALRRTETALGARKTNLAFPENLPLVCVDGLLLEQVFVNLFENAARHTPDKTKIEVSAREALDELIIEFSDNGPGFEPGSEEHIFDKLFRGKTSQGFGLGLAICKVIINAHGGTIKAQNDSPNGARIIFTLPAKEIPPEVTRG